MKKIYENHIKTKDFRPDPLQRKLCEILSPFLKQKGFFSKYPSNGVYIYGSVGTGKTTIMDLFFQNTNIRQKKRIHLSNLLLEIQNLIAEAKKLKYKDPLEYIFKKYRNIQLFCIDEFEIHDIVTSILIRRIMIYLINRGCVFILTSNSSPENLYKNGLQREKFCELIDKIRDKMKVFSLDLEIDYRKIDKNYIKEHKIITIDIKSDKILALKHMVFSILDENFTQKTTKLNSSSREIEIEFQKDLAIIDFEKFCKGYFGISDYQEICKNFEKILVYNIPKPNKEALDEYRRFCLLIDAIYDSKKTMYGICDFDYKNFDPKEFSDKIPQITRCFSRLFEFG